MNEEILINGKKITELSDMFFEYCELKRQTERLQEENEKIKNQYNCYACGNCNGKEDYINLEKHHKGLRKQFDELVKRNNTLSLRIEELETENEKLKARLKTLDDEVLTIEITPDEFERYKKYKQALEEIRKEANRLLYEENPIYGYNNSNHFEMLAKYVLAKTKEVLEDSKDVENN